MVFSHSMKQIIYRLCFIGIILVLVASRFVGNNYDNLRHLHPDERWLVMVVGKLHFFDNLNPDFFAYGSFPLYVLKAAAQLSDISFHTQYDNYDGLLVLGRNLVSILDIATAIFVFLITKKITKNTLSALFSMLGYTLLFFPIQNSNFFIVDNFVNLLFSATLLLLIQYVEKPNWKRLLILSVAYGLLLASKITPIILLAPIVFVLISMPFVSPILHNRLLLSIKFKLAQLFNSLRSVIDHKTNHFQLLFSNLAKSFINVLLFFLIVSITVFISMPFTLINYKQFINEISAQMVMNSNAYIFPYTLQYVDTTPYLYYLKQIAIWGAGPILSIIALGGLGLSMIQLSRYWKKRGLLQVIFQPLTIYLVANLIYFIVIGRSAVKFMRYMLPLYPSIAVFIGIALGFIFSYNKFPKLFRWLLVGSIIVVASLWTNAFISIYLKPHSRESASLWMLQNIPPGSRLAEEHWDDRLPLFSGELFEYIDLPLYELPDDTDKWKLIADRLEQADYIVMTSNRLYGSLPKLADCSNHEKCYPLTTQYYNDLFAENLNFFKVAEFTSRPSIFGIEIIDDNADESFTVYDHPKVIIFQKR